MQTVVMKFGGSSVATAEGWRTIASRIAAVKSEGKRPLVVCSALSGVSDLLESAVAAAPGDGHHDALQKIEAKHVALSADLGVDEDDWRAIFDSLTRVLAGVAMLGEAPASTRARVLSAGELMSTRLGAAWLDDVHWLDARAVLRSSPRERASEARNLLEAHVEAGEDAVLRDEVERHCAVLTQGFIARDPEGRTVLLGRGGSDTAAALFASRVTAARCEIWSDVPGIFSTNPRAVPSARLLTHLSYDLAEEIAAMGAKVLHPRALAPVRQAGIPMLLRWTMRPEAEGTRIDNEAPDRGPQVFAIAARMGVHLINLETIGMWHEVGYLARVFAAFARHGLSIDLLSSGQSSITVSLDPTPESRDPERIARLKEELQEFGSVRMLGPCASVSLVGRHIRAMLHRVGPSFEVFEDHPVHLVSQSASDRNLTFVVDESEAERLVARLHEQLISRDGPSWEELHTEPVQRERWWESAQADLLAIAGEGTPVYAYDLATVRERCSQLREVDAVDRWFYAMKANSHPEVLRTIAGQGIGLECVSPGELERAFEEVPELSPRSVLYTPNFAGPSDYLAGFERGVYVTVDNVGAVEAFPEVFQGRRVVLRIDPGAGRGHHAHVRTGGSRSKFGIVKEELPALLERLAALDCAVVGLHAHAGSGILDGGHWSSVAELLVRLASGIPTVEHIDVGGGLGVPVRAEDQPLDLKVLDTTLRAIERAGLELWMEPGRFLVAEAGVLLATVTQLKDKGARQFVGVDAGMHTLIRPALYGAWHEIANLTRLGEPDALTADVVGPICETGDTLGHGRRLPNTAPGDVLLVELAGAYGASMSSNYNLRGFPREVTREG